MAVTEEKKPFVPWYRRPEPKYRNVDRGTRWLAGIIEVGKGKISAEDLIAEMSGTKPEREPGEEG